MHLFTFTFNLFETHDAKYAYMYTKLLYVLLVFFYSRFTLSSYLSNALFLSVCHTQQTSFDEQFI